MAAWYCLIGQQQYGPFTSEQIQQLAQQGRLQREHYVRTETDSQWTAAGDLPGLFPAPQARPNPPPAPSVTPQPKKKKRIVPPAPPAAAPRPPAPASGGVPQARPVTPPAAAVPAAVPIAAAPLAAAPAGTPVAAMPAVAAPVATVRAVGKPILAARPVPLAPAVPPTAPTRDEGGTARKRRGSRQKSQLLVGGLTATLLLLTVIAVVVMIRSPGKKPTAEAGKATASAKGGAPEPSSNLEVDPEAPIAPASSEPGTIADPPLAASTAPTESAAEPKPNPLPAVGKWLDATRTKGGFRDLVAIGVGKAWLDKVAGKPAVLYVNVQLTNRSPDETLEFSGWRPDNQPQSDSQATMIDDAGSVLRAAPARPAAGRRAARRRIAPEESATEQLSFVFPDNESKHFRLALPYAALGQTGYLGFELPRQMIKEGDPDAQEKVRPEAVEPEPKPETLLPTDATVKPKPGEPETIGDLRSEIERSGDAKDDAMNEPSKPAADEPPVPAKEPQMEPEKTPDLRKFIEAEDRKEEAKDEKQPGGNMQEEPKSP